MKTDVKATSIIPLIHEAAEKKCKNIEVVFYPAYDKEAHKNTPDHLKKLLKKSKKEKFSVIEESFTIFALQKSKDVKSMMWSK